jgi:hypothetical protein
MINWQTCGRTIDPAFCGLRCFVRISVRTAAAGVVAMFESVLILGSNMKRHYSFFRDGYPSNMHLFLKHSPVVEIVACHVP